MANTTFTGAVRSENGFVDITKTASTGAITTNSTYSTDASIGGTLDVTSASTLTGNVFAKNIAPTITGQTITAKATASTNTYVAGINVNPYTGANAQVTTLPAATSGVIVIHSQSVDTTGGTATLIFDCAGTDVIETGSVFESRASSAVTFDTSTANETRLTYTPANAATNLMSIGSQIIFTCVTAGKWHVSARLRSIGAGTTGTFVFAA